MRGYVVMCSEFRDSYEAHLSRYAIFRKRSDAEIVLLRDFLEDMKECENDLSEISYSQLDGRYSFRHMDNYYGEMIKEVDVVSIPTNYNDCVYLYWGYFWEYNDWDGEVYAASGVKKDLQQEMKRNYRLNISRDLDWEVSERGEDSSYLETSNNERYASFVTKVNII